MKQLILPSRKEIITHSIALVLGFIIGCFIFTNTDYTEIENKTLELEKLKGELVEKEKNLTQYKELDDAYKSALSEIDYLNNTLNETLKENEKLKKIKVANASNLSDAELELFITEWAKRNGRLSQ